ncbi:hypothetical protein ACFIQF_08750 [Comamonas sp. J-3]|uniref:DUF7933 domain-containing protein n=1 Tax=Comamonas trifloxystrobinivorans TaxID=3350256 RepID=UPI003726C5E6
MTRRIEISGLPASGEKFKLYQFIDTFLDDRNPATSNDDQGPGFIRTTPNNTTNVPDYVGVVKGAQMETLVHDFSAQTPIWDRYFTGRYSTPLTEMGSSTGDLSNTVEPNSDVDNGLGVQWNVPSGAPSFVVQYRVAFTYSPVDLFKRFTPATVKTAEASRLTFSLANRQTTDVVGLGFTDNLPTGVTVAPTPNIQTSCPAGTAMSANLPAGMAVEATAGSASIKVSNATLQKVAIAGDELHCEIAVDVVATQPGRYHNKTDNITSLVNIANMVIDEVLEVVKRDIAATDDVGATNPNADQIAVADVLANDSFDGQSAVAARGLLTLSTLSSSHPNISLDSSSGAITVKKGTPAGDHSLKYQVCETALPDNCSTATASIKVTASAIVAQPDSGTADITSADQIAVPDVLANDSFNGQPASGSRSLLSLTALSASHANVLLNPTTGAISVKKGTPTGTQKLMYQICETALPDNCSTATVTLTVTLTAGKLVAQPDSASVNVSDGDKVAVADVLANDSFNGQSASAARGQLVLSTVSASHANLTLDPNSGAVSVKKGTPAGNQTLNYKVCEVALPDSCATATATITVSSGSLVAQPDSASVNVSDGDKVAVADVLANDSFNGQTASTARSQLVLSTVSASHANLTLDPNSGAVSVKKGTPAGNQTLNYKVCEIALPDNCATATATITVSSGNLTAQPDSASVNVSDGDKVAVADVLANDSFNGQAANTARSQLVLSTVSASHANLTLDPNSGAVSVKKGTPAGNQTLNYKVCEVALPDNCATATATITVGSGNLTAQPDSASVNVSDGDKVAVADVLANDSFNGQSASLARDQLVLTTESTTRAAEATTKASSITLDSATGTVTVKQGTPEGPHALVYKVCEKAQPNNCSTAVVSLTVTKDGGVIGNGNGKVQPVPVNHPLALLGLSGALGMLLMGASRRKQSLN